MQEKGVFFSLEYTVGDVLNHFKSIGGNPAILGDNFAFDDSDDISADYIVECLKSAPRETVIIIDYLQVLDQKRKNPDLMAQVEVLKKFARERALTIVFISQIDRSYDPSTKPCPGLNDVRLPNPLDLSLFDKTCFLHDGEIQLETTGSSPG